MMELEEIKSKLENILSPKRFKHSLNVMETAILLADRYAEDREEVACAGLLHDCAREIKGEEIFKVCEKFNIIVDGVTKAQPELLHGPIGAMIARTEYNVSNEVVLTAIRHHTTGRENMGMLEKIIFVADYIEPGRNFPEAQEARKVAFSDIDRAVLMALNRTIEYVLIKGVLIHTDTVFARNFMISSIKAKGQASNRGQKL